MREMLAGCWVVAEEGQGRGFRGELDSAAMEDGGGMVMREQGLGCESGEAKSELGGERMRMARTAGSQRRDDAGRHRRRDGDGTSGGRRGVW